MGDPSGCFKITSITWVSTSSNGATVRGGEGGVGGELMVYVRVIEGDGGITGCVIVPGDR